MAEEKPIEEARVEEKGAPAPDLSPDEYTPLVEDFCQVVERGLDSYQEQEVPGREINYVSLGMDSRTILACQTDERGIPQITVTGEEEDNRGRIKKQRSFIGASAEAATKGRGDKSANLAPRDTTVKEFEVGRQSYPLVESGIRTAQEEGEKTQRKIDEENYDYYPPLGRKGQETIINKDREPDIDLNKVRGFVAFAWQEIKRRLGAKAKEARVTFIKWTENVLHADTEGAKVSYIIPRVSFSISVKTTGGSEAFGVLRGACGTIEEIFTRNEPFRGMTDLAAVKALAAQVAKEAVELDRARDMKVVGSEFYAIFSPMVSGVLAHEVWGHPAEGDIIAKNRRAKDPNVNLKARLGAQVTSNKHIRMIDTGSPEVDLGDGRIIKHGFGSLVVDGRGDPANELVLIEEGTQKGALTDRYCFGEITDGIPANILTKMKGDGLTGNARREKYDYPLQVRMRNTFICPDPEGPKSPEEMASQIPRTKKGIYIVTCSGGWVDPDSGEFGIQGKLGYLIESGQITDKPIKDILIKDNITGFGDNIVALGKGQTITGTFPGYCGKDGQIVPVDGAGPLLLVKDIEAATTYRPWRWSELVADYRQQYEEVVKGKRRGENIYFPFLAEVLREGEKRSHEGICVVTLCLESPEAEVAYLLGLKEHADFESQDTEEGKKLAERRDPYA